jgi:predicted  nucleic acid-binding Zn-ribbon protein
MPRKRKTVKKTGYDTRSAGVQLDRIEHNVQLIAEQHGDIKKTLDHHTRLLDSHTEMIGNLAMDMEIVKTDVGVLKTDTAIMKTDIEFIKHGLKRKVDVEEFAALEQRVATLERRRG